MGVFRQYALLRWHGTTPIAARPLGKHLASLQQDIRAQPRRHPVKRENGVAPRAECVSVLFLASGLPLLAPTNAKPSIPPTPCLRRSVTRSHLEVCMRKVGAYAERHSSRSGCRPHGGEVDELWPDGGRRTKFDRLWAQVGRELGPHPLEIMKHMVGSGPNRQDPGYIALILTKLAANSKRFAAESTGVGPNLGEVGKTQNRGDAGRSWPKPSQFRPATG